MTRRHRIVFATTIVVAVGGGYRASLSSTERSAEHTYSVADVSFGLQNDSSAWIGMTVSVRGTASSSYCPSVGTSRCADPSSSYTLISGDSKLLNPQETLTITRRQANPTLEYLRSTFPILKRIIPAAQDVSIGESGIFRVTLQIAPTGTCYSDAVRWLAQPKCYRGYY